jgi:hypothetical protein
MPAEPKRESEAWYKRDGLTYSKKVEAIENLKSQMGLQ